MPWNETVTPGRANTVGEAGADLPHQAAVARCGEWDAPVVVARGAYDMDSITPLADALDAAARKHGKVVLDASGVTFADSTFLNLLIRTHQATTLRLVAPTPQVRRLLEVTGADSVLDVHAALDDAIAC
jgi:anti-anti-sigma factor